MNLEKLEPFWFRVAEHQFGYVMDKAEYDGWLALFMCVWED